MIKDEATCVPVLKRCQVEKPLYRSPIVVPTTKPPMMPAATSKTPRMPFGHSMSLSRRRTKRPNSMITHIGRPVASE